MNDWLKRKQEREGKEVKVWAKDLQDLKKRMVVTLWVNDADGRHPIPGAFPFEEVISITFASETVVSGFSLWHAGQELYWQPLGLVVSVDSYLKIDMKGLGMECLLHTLS